MFEFSGKSIWPLAVSILNFPKDLRDKMNIGLHVVAMCSGMCYLCFSNVFPMFFLCFSYVFPMFFLCFSDVFPMFFLCFPNVFIVYNCEIDVLKMNLLYEIMSTLEP